MCVPLQEIGRHEGYEVLLKDQRREPARSDDFLSGEWDVAVGQRLSNYEGLKMWRKTRLAGTRLVYELDDDVWNVLPENFQAYETHQDPVLREAIKAFMEVSDLVTTTTEHLAGVYRAWNPNVAVLPNCVPGWVLGLPGNNEGRLLDRGRERTRPRVGWVGGASHGRDIHVAGRPVHRFMKRNPEWDLYLGGTDYRTAFKLPSDRIVFGDWAQVNLNPAGFYQLYEFEIGICPLLDTTFARSKSAVKALEMNSRGIPVIASDVLPYREYVTHGYNGFLVRKDHEWLEYLTLLATDDSLRQEMAVNARKRAAEYTIENRWEEWARAYEGIL